jgi:hypothetical protein
MYKTLQLGTDERAGDGRVWERERDGHHGDRVEGMAFNHPLFQLNLSHSVPDPS